MSVIYIPLENMEQRYTVMFNEELEKIADTVLYPRFVNVAGFNGSAFLDFNFSCGFKAQQLQMIADLFQRNEVKDGDTFIVADIFFPGLEMIRLLAEVNEIYVYIAAFNHAGRSDSKDFVQMLGTWSDTQELAWHQCCDVIFVGSTYHQLQVCDYMAINNVVVTGMPFNYDWYNQRVQPIDFYDKRNCDVIWPHRPTEEKGFGDLLRIALANPERKFMITSCGAKDTRVGYILESGNYPNIRYMYNLTKNQYLEIFSKTKYYLSTAYQETFGYTLQEAINYNCAIIAPNRVAYTEQLPKQNLYNDISEVNDMLNLDSALLVKKSSRFYNCLEAIQLALEEIKL